jgi:hypothetical protein
MSRRKHSVPAVICTMAIGSLIIAAGCSAQTQTPNPSHAGSPATTAGTTGASGAPGTGAGGTTGFAGAPTGSSGAPTGSSGAPATGGAPAGTSGAPGAGGAPTGVAGAPTGVAGAPAGGVDPLGNCTTALAKTGAPCTFDCMIGCGFNFLGTKTCSCTPGGGVYTACPCPVPATWAGAPTAPPCTGTSAATAAALKGTPCTVANAECIGNDLVTGTTPQGCACLPAPTTNMLTWSCGSTNKWFAAQ